jgi:hypothetical protein
MEEMGRWGRRREQLLDYLEQTRRYWILKRKNYIARCGELALEGANDLS